MSVEGSVPLDPAATKERERDERRILLAGWIAGFVTGLTPAWWWGNIYLAFSVLLGGIILSVVAFYGLR